MQVAPLTPAALNSIHETVSEFRAGILDGRPSARMCDAVSLPLQGYLSFAENIKTEVVSRFFKIAGGELEHVWLEMPDGTIIDATADQMAEHGYPTLPPVYIGPKPPHYPK